MKAKTHFFQFALVLFITSCNSQQQQSELFDFGKVENGNYSNDFFGFNVTLPQEWYVQAKDSLVYKIKDMYKDKEFTGNSKNLQTSIEKTKPSTVNKAVLLTLFRYDIDSAVDLNYSFVVAALNLKNDPQLKTGKDCINEIIKQSSSHEVKRTINGEPQLTKIGNKDFYEITMEMEISEVTSGIVKQKYLSSVINNFNFSIILTYSTDEQLKELNNILATATFK